MPHTAPPIAGDDSFTVVPGGTLLISVIDLLANDIAPDGSQVSFVSATDPGIGSIVVDNRRVGFEVITFFAPDTDALPPGEDVLTTFTYVITDGDGDTDEGVVVITIRPDDPEEPENRAPEVTGSTIQVRPGQVVSLIGAFTATDPDGDPVALAFNPNNAGTVFGPDSNPVYTATFLTGTFYIDVTGTDPHGASGDGVITVEVVNNAPVVTGSEVTIRPGQSVALENTFTAGDPDGDELDIEVTIPAGTLVQPDPGVFTPPAGVGTYNVTVTATDPYAATGSGTVIVHVVNGAPTVQVPAQTARPGEEIVIAFTVTDPDGDFTTSVLTATVGTLQEAQETWFYTAPQQGQATITVVATDQYGATGTGSGVVTIVNGAPEVQGGIIHLRPGEIVPLTGLFTVTDPDGDSVTVTGAVAEAGSIDDQDTGLFTHIAALAVGEYDITITATDQYGATGTGTISVIVENEAPVVQGGIIFLRPGQVIALTGLYTVTDPDGDDFEVTSAEAEAGVIDSPAQETFVHTASTAPGQYDITIRARDQYGAIGAGTISVVVENAAPEVTDSATSIRPGQTLPLGPFIIATDPDGDAPLITAITAAAAGTFSNAGANAPTFTAPVGPNAAGPIAVTVSATDPYGAQGFGIVTVEVVNGAPQVLGGVVNIRPDQVVTLNNHFTVTEPDGDSFTLMVTYNGAGEIDQPGAPGIFQFIPPPAVGQFQVTVIATDQFGAQGSGVVTVNTVNGAPTVDDGGTSLRPGQTIPLANLVSITDPDGDPTTFVVASTTPEGRGSVGTDENGSPTFTAPAEPNAAGIIRLEIVASDRFGAEGSGTFTIEVINGRPDAAPDTFSTLVNTGIQIDRAALTANDSDPDGDQFDVTAISIAPGQGGTLTQNGNGWFFVPAANFTGRVVLNYTITDQYGATSQFGFAEITVNNRPPVANDDVFTTRPGRPVSFNANNLLANDSDPDGQAISLDLVGAADPAQGTLTEAGGTYTFTPAPGFTGQATFTYFIRDSAGALGLGLVTVDVANRAPVVVSEGPIAANLLGGSMQVFPFQYRNNDSDPDFDPITHTLVGQPQHGTATMAADGTITYTPTQGFRGVDTITYAVTDTFGAATNGTIRVAVNALPPIANGENIFLAPNQTLFIPFTALLANDTDPDGPQSALRVVDVPGGPQVPMTVGATGVTIGPLLAVPATGLPFRYIIEDADGLRAEAQSFIIPPFDAPPQVNMSQVGGGTPVGSTQGGPPVDPSSVPFSFAPLMLPDGQTLVLENTGTWNAIKNIALDAAGFAAAQAANVILGSLTVFNFVDARFDFSQSDRGMDGTVVGAKRGSLVGSVFDDVLEWIAHSNGGTFSERSVIDGGDGDDTITVRSVRSSTLDEVLLADNAQPGNGRLWRPGYDGAKSIIEIGAGAGNDLITVFDRVVTFIDAGEGNDLVLAGPGTLTAIGGSGNDTLILPGQASGYTVAALPDGWTRITDIDPADGLGGIVMIQGFEVLGYAGGVFVG